MIDAHVHLWRIGHNDCRWPGPDLPAIHRDFAVGDLLAQLDAHGVDRAILVQSQESQVDTRWLLDVAANEARIAGVVGWVDLTAADAPVCLDRLMQAGPLVGIRPMVQERGDDWYDDPRLEPALADMVRHGLVLEALVRPRHLPALARLAARWPDLTIMVDHCAKPEPDGFADWARAMRTLAAHPHVACKLSGLLTQLPAGASPADAQPWIDLVVDAFGAARLVWGSDWPVLTLAASYGDWHGQALDAIGDSDRPAIFAANAARLYRLDSAA